MYHKAYGIMETLAPLHVGASAGEESGNLNLIFRDQFTQTGIVPGSSIRGRFRADMRSSRQLWLEEQLTQTGVTLPDPQVKTIKGQSGKEVSRLEWLEHQAKAHDLTIPSAIDENYWYGHHAIARQSDGGTTEAQVKFEYASLVWLPVFCPGQPVVWVSCPRWLKRYQQITGHMKGTAVPQPIKGKYPVKLKSHRSRLFFSLGFLDQLENTPTLSNWVPTGSQIAPDSLVVVDDNDIAMIHNMALYRQTRTKLEDGVKKVENFFGFEALPEDSILVFPVAVRHQSPKGKNTPADHWQPFNGEDNLCQDLYLGGLESIGCGRTNVSLRGAYFPNPKT